MAARLRTWLAAVGASVSVVAMGQLPVARVDHVFPFAAAPGSEVEVTLAGQHLEGVSSIVCEQTGIRLVKADGAKLQLAIAPECPPGAYELRVAGTFGVSNPKLFVVGRNPVQVDPGGNHAAAKAMSLTMPVTVCGRFEPDQRDHYKVTLKKGEAVAISCESLALDAVADPVVTVRDASGRVVARGDDERDRDALVRFSVPADGEYGIEVHDKLFTGSAAHVYRLQVGAEVELLPPRTFASVIDFGVGSPGTVAEIEPDNNSPESPQELALPVRVEGALDVEWFSFSAEKGRALWIEVICERLDAVADPVLIVEKQTTGADGKVARTKVLELDDQPDLPGPPRWQAGSRDPAGRFVADETATYWVRVSNRFGGQPKYQLIVRDAAADFTLLAMAESPADEEKKLHVWTPLLRPGGSVAWKLGALRRGYDGEIVLRAEGLPEGVTVHGRIDAGANTGMLIAHATKEAKPWGGLLRIIGEGGGAVREAAGLTQRWYVENRDNQRVATKAGRIVLGVGAEPAPMIVEAVEEKEWEAVLGGTLEIPLKLSRPAALIAPKGEWMLEPVGLPGLKKFAPVKLDGGAANEAKLVISLQDKDGNKFAPGNYEITVCARGVVTYRPDEKAKPRDVRHVEYSRPIRLKLNAPAVAEVK